MLEICCMAISGRFFKNNWAEVIFIIIKVLSDSLVRSDVIHVKDGSLCENKYQFQVQCSPDLTNHPDITN